MKFSKLSSKTTRLYTSQTKTLASPHPGICGTLVVLYHHIGSSLSPQYVGNSGPGWSAPLYNLYFDSFFLICTSFVVRTGGIVCVVYLLFRLANFKDPCKRCMLAKFARFVTFVSRNVGHLIVGDSF